MSAGRCIAPVDDSGRLCGAVASTTRVAEDLVCPLCVVHAGEIDSDEGDETMTSNTATANDTTTNPAYEIRKIEITEGAQEWGCDLSSAQDDAMHERYDVAVMAALAKAFPDVEITHSVDRRISSRTEVHVTLDVDADECVEYDRDGEAFREIIRDDAMEALGAAWQDVCEKSGDLFGKHAMRGGSRYAVGTYEFGSKREALAFARKMVREGDWQTASVVDRAEIKDDGVIAKWTRAENGRRAIRVNP